MKCSVNEELFENTEFFILEDDSNFFIEVEDERQNNSFPVAITLTNLHIFAIPMFDVLKVRKISFNDISICLSNSKGDDHFLRILVDEPLPPLVLRLASKEEYILKSFADLFTKFNIELEKESENFNTIALYYKRLIQSYKTVNEFYFAMKKFNHNVVDIDYARKNMPDSELIVVDYKINKELENSFKYFDFIGDMFCVSPNFYLYMLFPIIILFSFIFRYVCFGTLFPTIIFSILLLICINKARGEPISLSKLDIKDIPKAYQGPFNSYNEFITSVNNRILWENPDLSLEFAIFFLTLATLFLFLDTVFLLFVSIAMLAFIDRWDPVGLGSFSYLLSKLILW